MLFGGNLYRTGFFKETKDFFNALGISYDNTVYYASTPQEITGKLLWETINNEIKEYKNANLWNKLQFIYPIIGGTSLRHSYNLKNTSEFQQTFFGDWVHNALGMTGNGVNTYSTTNFIPVLEQNVNNNGLTIVSGTDNVELTSDTVIMGAFTLSDDGSLLVLKSSLSNEFKTRLNNNFITDNTNTDSLGIFTASKENATTTKIYKNKIVKQTGNSGGILTIIEIYIGTLNLFNSPYSAGFTTQRIQSAFSHEGLTDGEVEILHQIIDNREATLNRKTW